jgi:hypothetical protein
VARSIAEELRDARLVPVHRTKEESIGIETDTIGLVFPVYWEVFLSVLESFFLS